MTKKSDQSVREYLISFRTFMQYKLQLKQKTINYKSIKGQEKLVFLLYNVIMKGEINMEEKIKSAANEIVKKISELPVGSEFVIGDYFDEYKFENEENFKLIKEVLSLCESSNVKIENTQAGMILGMPWVYKYKKNN